MSKNLIKVTQVCSSIGQTKQQKSNLCGIGLRKIGDSKVLKDSPEVLGMINKVKHLLLVEKL